MQDAIPEHRRKIEISWGNIVHAYEMQFEAVYGGEPTKKLHLSDSTKVDGASDIWMELSLLDAIISSYQPPARISHRRLFDQRRVLIEAVFEEVTNKYLQTDTAVTEAFVNIDPNHWKDFDRLRSHIISSAKDRVYHVTPKLESQIGRLLSSLSEKGSLEENIEELIRKVCAHWPVLGDI